MKGIPKDDIKRRELSYKATTDVLKATNVFPSPQYAQNIYNDNSQQIVITPEFQAFLYFQSKNGEKMLKDSDGVNQSS